MGTHVYPPGGESLLEVIYQQIGPIVYILNKPLTRVLGVCAETMLLRCSSARAYAVVLETAPLQRFLVLRTNALSKIVFYYRFMHNSASTTLVRTTSRITVHFLSRKWPPEVPYPKRIPLRGLFVGCALSGARKRSLFPWEGARRKRQPFH